MCICERVRVCVCVCMIEGKSVKEYLSDVYTLSDSVHVRQ